MNEVQMKKQKFSTWKHSAKCEGCLVPSIEERRKTTYVEKKLKAHFQ